MMMMALSVKFSFTSLGSACDLKLELEIHRQEKDMTARNTERMKKGQADLEGNGTLVEVNAMSAGAFLQPPEGLSCGPVPAEPVRVQVRLKLWSFARPLTEE